MTIRHGTDSTLADQHTESASRALYELWMASYSTTDRLRWFASRIDRMFERKLAGGLVTLEQLADNLTSVLEREGRIEDALLQLAREQRRRWEEVRQVAGLLGLNIDVDRLATEPARLEDFSRAAASFTRDVLEWEAKLPSGAWIPRAELATIHERLAKPGLRTIALLGDAGSGKSALMATLGRELQERGEHVLGLRLDRLPREVVRADQLQEHLELPVPLHELVSSLASAGPVVVLIDQLDALCDLLSEHGERLDLVLRTIDALTQYEGVRVVLACRPFEFNYDVRLRRTDPEAITLNLPPWSEVEPHIRAAQVTPELLSNGLREELCRPQVLHTFLTLVSGGSNPLELTTYHAMRQKMWEVHVDEASERQRLEEMLFELADWMANHGQLERPRSGMGEYKDELKLLQDAGWISLAGPRESRVRFRHESFFDFTLARRITAAEESLLAKVLQQQGLWIRRRIWAVLTYLRDEDPKHYQREFDTLWGTTELRRHLRYLLIDFLGQVRDITEFEYQRMREALRADDLRGRAWKAVGRDKGWFSWLRAVELPEQMRRPDEYGRAFSLLSRAATEHPDQVVELLDRLWAADVERGRLTLLLLERVPPTAAGATPLMRKIAVLLGLRGTWYSIEALILAVRESDPGLAFSLLAEAFVADFDRAQALPDEHFREQIDAAKPRSAHLFGRPVEANERNIASARRAHVRAVIEAESVFLGFEPAIEAHPGLFIEAIMPPLTRALATIARAPSDPRTFRPELDWPDVGPESQYSLVAQVESAVCALARQSADEFAAFVSRHASSDLSTIHHLLLNGLRYATVQLPELVVEYFRGDPRRLRVGTSLRPAKGTLVLLQAVAAALPDGCQRELAQIFLAHEAKWTYPAGAKLRRMLFAEAREHRLALLLTLKRDALDEKTRRRIDEDMRACPNVALRTALPRRHRGGVVPSPMSTDQMAQADDAAILKLFDELPEATDWDHPRASMLGGSIVASRALVDLVKREPQRGWQLMRQMLPHKHERPAGMIFEALVEDGADSETSLQWFWQAEDRGFASSTYRDAVARALESLARRPEHPGLPEDVCTRLREWLGTVNYEHRPGQAVELERPDDRAILSEPSATMGLPNVSHSTLAALFAGLLLRASPAWEEWLAVASEHLERGDDVIVWQHLALDRLKWVVRADRGRATAFLVRLYEVYPELMDCGPGLGLIDDVQKELDRAQTQGWIEALRQMGDEWHAQAFGEMLVLRTFRLPDDTWSRQEIAALIADESEEPAIRAMRCGVAHILADAMRAGTLDDSGFRWLVALAPAGDKAISKCLRDCVWCMMDQPPTAEREEFLRCLLEHPRHFAEGSTHNLVVMMSAYIGQAPALVADLSQKVLQLTKGKGIEQEEMLRIIVTLQSQPGFVARGLDLFEQACALEMPGTDELLDEHREVARESVAPRPRRRGKSR